MEAFLGIDVSKGYADFALLTKEKKELEKVFQLDDNRQGHDSLEALLRKQIGLHKIEMLYCAVESTGGYENNWYSTLGKLAKAMKVKLARLNPNGVRKNSEAGLDRNVTDALSSRYVGEYLIDHADKVDYREQSGRYGSFRSLTGSVRMQNKQKTQLINHLKSLLYSSFPELVRFCKDSTPNWVLEVLKKYPTAAQVAKATTAKLAKLDHVTPEKAASLIGKASSSVASRTGKTQEFLIRELATEIMHKQELLETLKGHLAQECKGPEVDLVDSLPGFAAYSAAATMVEIEDIARFGSPKELVSYFGLHPELKDSGDKKGVHHMSKKGRSSMRGILYMCAQTAVRCDEHLKKIYHNHRGKGMCHKQAIGVIMQKLLRIVWGVLTHKKPYRASVDKANQANKVPAKKNDSKKQEMKSKRRYQDMGIEAPISNKQSKIRKVHLESQSEQAGNVRDHLHAPSVNI
jgi:transposase